MPAVITACDPIVSIGLSYVFPRGSLATTPAGIAGQVLSLLLMTGGIILIAHRSPQVVHQLDQARQPAPAPAVRRGRARTERRRPRFA